MNSNKSISVLSLGYGVQSLTLAAMAAVGEWTMPDYIVHADTGYEMSETYQLAAFFDIWFRATGIEIVTLKNPCDYNKVITKNTDIPAYAVLKKKGQLNRQCTNRYKIQPIRRFISLMLKERGLRKTPGIVTQCLGITVDEIQRMRDSDVKYIRNSYPLIEMGMRRVDCLSWLKSKGFPIPSKSSCTFCPYHSKRFWEEMKRKNGHNWNEAVRIDEKLRDARYPFKLYVFSGCIPLKSLRIPEDVGLVQLDMFDNNDACVSGFCFI